MTPKQIAFQVFRALVFLLSAIFLVPPMVFAAPTTGLDPSWQIALNLARINDFTYGKDFIFTFGPFGYLTTRLPIGVTKAEMLIFDLFLLALLLFILIYVFRQARSYTAVLAVFLTVLLVDRVQIYTISLSNILLLAFLFLLFHHLTHGHVLTLVLSGVLAWFLFYFKLNTGLPAVLLMVVTLLYLLAFPGRRSRRFIALFGVIFLAAGPVLARLLNTDLIGYIQGALHLSSAYSDAMSIPFKDSPIGVEFGYLALAILVAFGLVFVVDFRPLTRSKQDLLQYLFTAGFLFVMFKHGFVRTWGHPWLFFQVAAAGIGVLYLFTADARVRGHLGTVFLASLLLSFPAVAQQVQPDYLVHKFSRFGNYLYEVFTPGLVVADSPDMDQVRLPQAMLDTVDGRTVDVIPWEISYVYANDLDYNPRPVIQTYTAYDAYLDGKNRDKYLSDSAPDFVLFNTDQIDFRHPFFDEMQTKLALLQRYQVVWKYRDDFLLLRKLDTPRALSRTEGPSRQGHLNTYIELPDSGGIQVMTAGIRYSLLGRLAHFFYQPPLLNVKLQFEDGSEEVYRAVKPIVNGGAIVNPFVGSLDAAEVFLDTGGALNRRVARLKFLTDGDWAYRDEFDYQFATVTVENDRLLGPSPIDLGDGRTLALAEAHYDLHNGQLAVDLLWPDSPAITDPSLPRHYTVYAHLVDRQQNGIAGSDVLLQEGQNKVREVQVNGQRYFVSRHDIQLPDGLPPGTYDLATGAYYFENGQAVEVWSTTVRDFIRIP